MTFTKGVEVSNFGLFLCFLFFNSLSVVVFGFVCVFAATYDCTTVRLGQHTLEKEINLKSFSLIRLNFKKKVMTD